MTPIRIILCAVLPLTLGACASSPPIHYFSLDDGKPTPMGSPAGPHVVVTEVNLPELVDRPQLIIRTAGHQLQLDDQYTWAEPLRRQVPRVIARHLGQALDSSRVFALPIDAQRFDPDFKLMLDFQRLEVISGKYVELDAVWRVEPRAGRIFFGRSLIFAGIEPAKEPGGKYAEAVAAQNRALQSLTTNIAAGITGWLKEVAADFPTDRNTLFDSAPAHVGAVAAASRFPAPH